MENESHDEESGEMNQDELMEQAKQLLTLTNLVDMYPAVVERRVTGLIFLLIGGGVSIATLVFTTLIGILEELGLFVFGVVGFILVSLGVSALITFKIVKPITMSYSGVYEENENMSKAMKVFWGSTTIVMVVAALYLFSTNQAHLFTIIIQCFLIFGNGLIYYEMRMNPSSKDYSFPHLLFVIIIALSIIPLVVLPVLAYTVMILVDIGGLYGLGIYILITAERILVETLGSD